MFFFPSHLADFFFETLNIKHYPVIKGYFNTNDDYVLSIINQNDDEGKLLFASQDGLKKELNNKNLIFSYISHPLMSLKIIGAIHFEALKLWLKGIKFVKKKIKIKNNITFET